MGRIYHTTTVDITDYEVDVEIDTDDILQEMDNDDLIEHVKDNEGADGLVRRIYAACSELRDPLVAHDDACGLAVDIVAHDIDRFVTHIRENLEMGDEDREKLAKALYAGPKLAQPDPAPEAERDVSAVPVAIYQWTTDQKKNAILAMLGDGAPYDSTQSALRAFTSELGWAREMTAFSDKLTFIQAMNRSNISTGDAVYAMIDAYGMDWMAECFQREARAVIAAKFAKVAG